MGNHDPYSDRSMFKAELWRTSPPDLGPPRPTPNVATANILR
jgi:hypothetical protein